VSRLDAYKAIVKFAIVYSSKIELVLQYEVFEALKDPSKNPAIIFRDNEKASFTLG
jgi:hypothetical protein